MPVPVALLDANVLYPARLRDLFIRLHIAGLYRARWSERVLDECFRNLLVDRPDLSPAQFARTRELMATAVPDAVVTGYEHLIEAQDLPDTDDRHVLAAAIASDAAVLVTQNLIDFPDNRTPAGLDVLSPDEFVHRLAHGNLDSVADVIQDQADALANPPMTRTQVLDGLDQVGLTRSVELLRTSN